MKSLPAPLRHHINRGIREAGLLLLLALAVYLLVALWTYDVRDPGWSYSAPAHQVRNAGGAVGALFADFSLYLFGYLAYLLPVMIGWGALQVYRWQRREGVIRWGVLGLRFGGFVATVVTGSALATLHFKAIPGTVPLTSGGVLGDLVRTALEQSFSSVGATLFTLAAFLGGVTLFTGLSWISLMDLLGRLALRLVALLVGRLRAFSDYLAGRRAKRARAEILVQEVRRAKTRKPPQIEPVITVIPEGNRVRKERQIPLFKGEPTEGLPPVSLLEPPPLQRKGYSSEALAAISKQVELKLQDFGVEVEVVAVQPGPVITRFELQPAPGVKVSQISNLEKDLARSLSVTSVRVVEVIPGKSVVGLEIPNEQRQLIAFSEIIRSQEFERASSPLTLALGKDIGGRPVVADLARMPHLLVAGTTGSGKSVGVNGMILSLL
ncbi:MAG TPA: DNA translocase FtsK 4TM domain-containing protein, partial [Gammaproteobacteria bacterium]|nr:DNA translocase FtsK 4TM domain-containing protein [Gammaproteobacteria bacterium]